MGRNDKEEKPERENQANSDGPGEAALPGVFSFTPEHLSRQPHNPYFSFIGPACPLARVLGHVGQGSTRGVIPLLAVKFQIFYILCFVDVLIVYKIRRSLSKV